MHHFFADPGQIEGNVIHITGSDVNHIKNVLRMRLNEEMVVSDGQGKDYRCYIEELGEWEVLAHVIYAQEADAELPGKIYLFQGLPKGDKMELIIQKAVELGAHQIIPVATSRSVVRLDAKKAEKKTARWQQIAEGAAKQSGRAYIPQVGPVCSYREALTQAEGCDVRLIPYEMASNMEKTKNIIGAVRPGQSVAVFIGPEGGFSEEEISMAEEAGLKPITLGRRILRTETAGLALLSVLMFHMEEER